MEDTSSFGNIKIARRISVPNPDDVRADIFAVDIRNTVSSADRLQDFDASYRERIKLEIRMPQKSAPNALIPVVVSINDFNDRAMILDPQRPICLGYRWFNENGPLWLELPRIPVESYVRPSTEVAFTVLTPAVLGHCVLEVDLLIEGELWLGRLAQAGIEIG